MVGRKWLAALVVVLGMAVSAPQAMAKQDILFGGASITGVYYQVALQLSNMMNKHAADKYNYIGRPTGGSVFNINAIDRGAFDFAVAQSDRNWQGFNGAADWEGKPVTGLRSVFSMHPETVLLVTRKDAGIKTVMDMKGKRINIGNPGSGQRGNAEDVLRIYGLDYNKDFSAEALQQAEASRALVDQKVDAFFFTVGNPSAAVEEPAQSVDLDIIAINSDGIKDFVAKHPYYIMTTIPAGTYKGVDKDVETYAVTATVISNESVSEEVVYDMVKTVFENLDELKASHAAFRNLNPKEMLQGLSAPLHPGAIKYYKEKGWM
ncbi:TAXI family TRAP transporter solute-binding subunit [Desulfomicrobium baculatum]|uniref:TRAP transporter solute receptor, TAXI family n=1 Tax=Desulfomicrobium baculatum (strain DSM 4028 / VKM B-1378 / X) TaxID=525897 RepID=C7LSE9_DESBD|nr:TAXI family TRAP transporter solute-binding subunit [Desulfomicrobium baculatum]ACU88163.1 TRAP transporter solute receptor, TAXI family [Desulfomicrobium baculatum DSM 4028]